MVAYIISITVVLVGLILYVKPITTFFEFETLHYKQLFISIAIGFVSVIWFEWVKLFYRIRTKEN